MQSGLDGLSNYLSEHIRSAGDFVSSLVGTEVNVIRIKKSTKELWAGNNGRDHMGDFNQKLESPTMEIIDNIIIKYPSNKIELFGSKVLQQSITTTVNPEEQLPIEFFMVFKGDYNNQPNAIVNGDLIIDFFMDENFIVIPIYLEVSQTFGSLFGKNIIRKQGTLVPYRGKFEKPIEHKIKKYFESFSTKIGSGKERDFSIVPRTPESIGIGPSGPSGPPGPQGPAGDANLQEVMSLLSIDI